MPIYLLGPLVVCGTILVVLLVNALFNQRPRELSDRRDIETLFLMAFPETLIVEPVLIGGGLAGDPRFSRWRARKSVLD